MIGVPKNCDPVITVQGLRNSFGEQVIHEDLDLTVCRGEILGVVGGSGTGKSVLMRSVIGLQTPDSGDVEVLGENMIDRDEDEAKNIRRRWGILFQNGARARSRAPVPRRADRWPRPDRRRRVRRSDPLAPEEARPDRLPDHA